MVNPRRTKTNAADSAPGVDDGRKGAPAPPVDSHPGGRRVVLWIVLASLVVLALVFIARPAGNRPAEGEGGAIGAVQQDLQVSRDPKADDANQSASTP